MCYIYIWNMEDGRADYTISDWLAFIPVAPLCNGDDNFYHYFYSMAIPLFLSLSPGIVQEP